jgi:hypothetical protein
MSDELRPEEVLAASFIKSWAVQGTEIENLGNGDSPDIRITYPDGRKALCEVKRDADPIEEQMQSRLNRFGFLDLENGSGSWLITLDNLIDLLLFKKEIQSVVNDLNEIGIDDWDKRDRTLKFKSQDFLLRNTVSSFRRIKGYEGNRVIMMKSPKFGVVLEDPNSIIPWLESVQYRTEYRSSLSRLVLEDSVEQHLFIFVDSNTPHEIASILQFHPNSLPTEALHLPGFLTHIWISSFFNFVGKSDYAWVYSKLKGWELAEIERIYRSD